MAKRKLPKEAIVELPGREPITVTLYADPPKLNIELNLERLYDKYVCHGVLKGFFTTSHMVEDVWRGRVARKVDGRGFKLDERGISSEDLLRKVRSLASSNGSACGALLEKGLLALDDQKQRQLKEVSQKHPAEVRKAARQLEWVFAGDALANEAAMVHDDEAENPPILLLLESPHDAEYLYCDDKFSPLVPANSSTGTAIVGGLGCLLSQISEDLADADIMDELTLPAPLIICNPVRFQTSLHFLLRKHWQYTIRDHVWRRLWTTGGVELGFPVVRNFVDRIISYDPQLILNACTCGVSRFVQNALNKVDWGRRVPSYVMFHPARNWPNKYGLLAQER